MSKPWKTKVVLYDKALKMHREVEVAVEVDWNGIAKKVGQAAINNRSGKSSYVGGLIHVSVVR